MTTHADHARSPKAEATLSLLWERIRRQGDMPGFTKAINAILASMRGEDEREFSMTQTVLSDPVLTQKVLRLANSGMYSAFGQRVNTVSKAVLVLGTEAIGHLALGLKLIEELAKSTPDTETAHIEMEKAVLAGMVAQQVAASAVSRDPEEAVVCSILHSLGRMMITFYMPERWLQLREAGGEGREEAGAEALLGLSLEAVGRATAEHWGLPRNLIAGMRRVEPCERGEGFGHDDWLAALGTMSTQAAEALWHDDEAGVERVAALAESFAPLLGVEACGLLKAIDRARETAAADLSIAPLAKPAEKREQQAAASRKRTAGNKVLMSGVADMRDAGTSASPGQMMSMALETMHKGLSFTRSFAFLRNRRDGKYAARLGLGEGSKQLLPNLVFDDVYEPNVFHASLGSDRVIFIENARDLKFASKLPLWWKETLSEARSFVVIPLCAHGQPAGFIYGEWDDSFPQVVLSQTEFSLLNDLRGLVVRTVEKRHQVEAVATRV
ncbi:HDOD domain-containing protein [Massilia yuzhufengensis]|uniref:HDOD domain-containing protein n=1 Tax=Massilia yuzhufengensis TaxID=1164594 RepID=A0A1I1MC94_9BURK|nr:HDOD domain-containing protein [Massilia yuzhufengensis]SFC79300.1 HDOD domain-containing protein [Massilia yuzhufengensis]